MVKNKPTQESAPLSPRTCTCCGKTFTPYSKDDWGCSPTCRALSRVKTVDQALHDQKVELQRKIEATRYIPKFNLMKNPMARVDWVMSLPIEYRCKYVRFFSEAESAYMKELCKSMLAEERQYLGYFVKKDKIVLVKGACQEEPVEAPPDSLDNDGTENED